MQEEINQNNEAWAMELRRADERSHTFKEAAEGQERRRKQVEERFEYLEGQVRARDDEIGRLNDLYQGG